MKRLAPLILAPALLGPAQACELSGAETVDLGDGMILLHRTGNQPPVAGRHFTLQFRICRGGKTLKPDRFKIDAKMPAHNHGMNYRVAIDTALDGHIEASGLLFHMPGHWQVRVDFTVDDAIQQVNIDYRI